MSAQPEPTQQTARGSGLPCGLLLVRFLISNFSLKNSCWTLPTVLNSWPYRLQLTSIPGLIAESRNKSNVKQPCVYAYSALKSTPWNLHGSSSCIMCTIMQHNLMYQWWKVWVLNSWVLENVVVLYFIAGKSRRKHTRHIMACAVSHKQWSWSRVCALSPNKLKSHSCRHIMPV